MNAQERTPGGEGSQRARRGAQDGRRLRGWRGADHTGREQRRRSVWIDAARPKTLPAAVAPVLIGTAAAVSFSAPRFLLALLVALALQVGVNYANDYFDGVAGVDTEHRLGPPRAVAGGRVTPGAMRTATIAAFAVAAAAGVTLGALAGWELVAVGAAALAAAVGYSGGPRPYASAGLGELFVFVFFGLVATVGSTYVQDEVVRSRSVIAAFTPGLIAVALLVVNNLRDIVTDAEAGKRTLSVRIGDRSSRRLAAGCVVGAFIPPLVLTVVAGSAWPLLALGGVPLARRVLLRLRRARGRQLIGVLTRTGRLQLILGVLFAAGIALI